MNRDELAEMAIKLYNGGKGLSYPKIAAKFNSDGIPTVSGSGKWEQKMVQRLVAGAVKSKAEVKTGLKSDREVQLESEVESLKLKLNQLASYRAELFSENNKLESENAGLRSDRDEALKELNTVKQENEELVRKDSFLRERLADSVGHVNGNLKVIADLTAENDRLKEGIEQLRTQRDCFKAESERLNRQLVESESKYKTLYESEINRLGSELAKANQRIQELQDKQVFIKPESESGIPKNFNGWTLGKRSDGRGYNIYRKIGGKLHGLYIGKEWDESDARQKIAAFESKQKPQSELFAGSDCKSCQHQPEFESRLRAVCPEMVRTYRLDTVAKSFHDYDFSREMIALAEEKRIELLAGDASQCDVSKLVQYRGRMYVNFEWR